ncbi:class I tRNA ligase family protein [Rhizobium sp. FY34]|uniref:class I tRNA ligase family protein n=1 Tax=Rhizobium sp. FY34 TaxID=2562309 RepID=UPI0014859DA3|nr:class I tRNA ligase family protein [Rhizobium sp. FY34]
MAKLIVTCAPPTSNGDLHLGHLAGPYLASDVFTRIRRLLGDDVHYVSYSDDYQSYVVRKARGENRPPEAVARQYGPLMARTLAKARIEPDHFMHTLGLGDHYLETLSSFYLALKSAGTLFSQRTEVPFSQELQLWGYEAFARGTCPNCGDPTDTSQCEGCAMPPDLARMRDVRCIVDGQPMGWVEVNQLFLDVEKNRAVLQELYRRAPFRPALRDFTSLVLDEPILPWAISRPHDWGPRVPDDPAATLHTWFGGIAGYCAASQEWALKLGEEALFSKYWRDKETRLIHFVGIDCAYSHAVAYPIMLAHLPVAPTVGNIFTNQFLSLHGHDFSTSRGVAIWASEFLDNIESDSARFYLALRAPETTEQDFDLDEFRLTINDLLASRLMNAIASVRDGKNEEPLSGEAFQDEFGGTLESLRQRFMKASSVESFSMNVQGAVLVDLIGLLDSTDPRQLRTVLSIYSLMATAIQPSLSSALAAFLRLPNKWGVAWLLNGGSLTVPSSEQVGEPSPTIQEIGPDIIKRFKSTFEAAVKAA